MPQYFLCYRRNDSAGHAGRLYSDLVRAFDEEAVFFDLKSVPPGEDYRHAVRRSITESSVVLVVIGRNWTPSLLHDLDDDVRDEIVTALGGGKRVIPVLVQGAVMPAPSELPEALRELSYRHASEISDRHWDADVKALINLLRGAKPGRTLAKIIGAAAVVLALAIGFYATRPPAPTDVTTTTETSRELPPMDTRPTGTMPAGNAPAGNAPTGNEPAGNPTKIHHNRLLSARTITTRSGPVIPLTTKPGAMLKAKIAGGVPAELRLGRQPLRTPLGTEEVAVVLTAGEHDLILNIDRRGAPWTKVTFTLTLGTYPRTYIFAPKEPPEAGEMDSFRWRLNVKE